MLRSRVEMALFLLKRVTALVPVLFGVAVITFALLQLTPGDPVDILLGADATPEARQAYREELNLDGRVDERFVAWFERALHGDLGTSISRGEAARTVTMRALQNTAQLALVAILLALIVGVPLGLVMSWWPGRGGSALNFLTVAAMSIPSFWLGLILLYVFSIRFQLLPSGGMLPYTGEDGLLIRARHTILPAAAVAVLPTALIARLTRTLILELRRQDFVVTLHTRRYSTPRIWRHLLRNASPGIVNIAGLQAGYVILGTLFVEIVFTWPGIGTESVQAIQSRDYPVIQAIVLMTGLVFALITLLTDFLIRLLDPRVAAH
jgi:peptide/nickel transport system permease protein